MVQGFDWHPFIYCKEKQRNWLDRAPGATIQVNNYITLSSPTSLPPQGSADSLSEMILCHGDYRSSALNLRLVLNKDAILPKELLYPTISESTGSKKM